MLLSPIVLAGIAFVVLVAGAVNGLAGFGFALVGTMALASAIDPATAVVFMIVPILAVNLSLVRDLSHGVFVGVVAMVFLGLNGIRVGAAGALGLYPSAAVAIASVGAAVPAIAGVAVGKRFRSSVAEQHRRIAVLSLLAVIGVRLVLGGLGIA